MLREVNNNLPVRIGEYEESELLSALTRKDEFRTTVNTSSVMRAVAELYHSGVTAVSKFLAENNNTGRGIIRNECRFPGFEDTRNFTYQSILLGTRHFNPRYVEINGGIREPFRRWIVALLRDFGLTVKDVFGATIDKGPDVKRMLESDLSLRWEWCIPHRTNASTKTAFGITPQRSSSKNLGITDLISRISKTIYAVRSNEKLGLLFAELCTMLDPNATTKLLNIVIIALWSSGEFLGIEKALRERKMPPDNFPLVEERQTLLQMYALLEPITVINTHSQSESANQPEVLGLLNKLRRTVLDETQQLLDCFRKRSPPI
ncbi:Hypothetical protein PHPALM_17592 [Phytophthora palmivora]|uniref:Uncharacterized protein n=1 Tax=Phytophthora palmivora TaxID=4796 RepID=A0A2P4XLU6_9STRA|nr:Hypothetical protein PHPALM_17592 [Phytophthora palmivora]